MEIRCKGMGFESETSANFAEDAKNLLIVH